MTATDNKALAERLAYEMRDAAPDMQSDAFHATETVLSWAERLEALTREPPTPSAQVVGHVCRDVSQARMVINLPEGTPLYTTPSAKVSGGGEVEAAALERARKVFAERGWCDEHGRTHPELPEVLREALEAANMPSPQAQPQGDASGQVSGGGEDFARGIAFIVRNKDALIALTAGPSERYVVEQTIASLSSPQARPDYAELLARERAATEWFALRVLGEDRYGNSPCQAHPLQLVEEYIEELKAAPSTPSAQPDGNYAVVLHPDVVDAQEVVDMAQGGTTVILQKNIMSTPQARLEVRVNFPQVGTAGPFSVIDGAITLPDETMNDLIRHARTGYVPAPTADGGEAVAWRWRNKGWPEGVWELTNSPKVAQKTDWNEVESLYTHPTPAPDAVARLVEAAQPFDALYQPNDHGSMGDEQPDMQGIFGVNNAKVTLGDLRRLRRAIKEATNGQE